MGRSSPHPGGRRGGSPHKTHEPSPAPPGPDRPPSEAAAGKSSDEEGKRLRDEAEAQAQGDPRRAPRTAPGTTTRQPTRTAMPPQRPEGFAPRWHKPSEAAVLEKTARIRRGRPEPGRTPSIADPEPSPREAKTKVLDADEGKRGSTASQYDNSVPEDGQAARRERWSARAQSPRRPAEPGASPSRARPGSPSKSCLRVTSAPVPARRGRSRGRAPPFVQ